MVINNDTISVHVGPHFHGVILSDTPENDGSIHVCIYYIIILLYIY